jgi:hypothetical protein
MHRVLNAQVDPSIGTLREIAFACGLALTLETRRTSDPDAAAAARFMLDGSYTRPATPEVDEWVQRLGRMADAGDPMEVVRVAAESSSPLCRPGAVLLAGSVALGRLASAGDASRGRWAISGAAGLYLPTADSPAPSVTILWCDKVHTVLHLLGDAGLRETHRRDRAAVAVIHAEPELHVGSFTRGYIRYAAPIQIVLDCIAQGGQVAEDATEEARSW